MRRPRPLLLLAAAAAAACAGRAPAPASSGPATQPRASAEPTTLRYATGPGRYRVEGQMHTEQEVMGNSSAFDLITTTLVSTVMSEEAGNLSLAITVDSMNVSGNAPGVSADAFAAAVGRTFRALFTASGRSLSVTAPDSTNAVFAQLARGFREFVPVLPVGPITTGMTWSDTVTQTVPSLGGGGTATVQSRREHRVVGWETRDGVRALHLATTASLSLTGSGEVQGQPIEMTGTGTAVIDRYVSAAGVYLGATQTDSTQIAVNVLSVGITVPVRQTQRSTVTRLP